MVKDYNIGAIATQNPLATPLIAVLKRLVNVRAIWLVPNAVSATKPLDLNRRLYRQIVKWGRVAVASNSHYTDRTLGLGAFERHVIYPGVDIESFRADESSTSTVRQALGIPPTSPVVGMFAQIKEAKGQERLVQALAESGTPFHVIICGEARNSEYEVQLKAKIEKLGLRERVHFVGLRSDLVPYYTASDLVASLYLEAEAYGLSIVEAMSCRRPVLAHKLGGPSETVIDGVTGWLLNDAEVGTISAALRKAMQERERWREYGEAGRIRATQFSTSAFLDDIEALLSAR